MSGTSVPYLTQYVPGSGVITAAGLNTFVQGGCYLANLRAFTGLPNQNVQLIGFTSQNDGGQGTFVWSSNVGTDDGGVTTIVPYGVVQGCWLRQIPGYINAVTAVTNIASLRAQTSSTVTGAVVFVEGYYNGADGGEGLFWDNTADTTSVDNGGTIIVDSSQRRWYREGAIGQAWSIAWFGASPGLADNTGIVNGMITILGAAGGGVITSPANTYQFLGTLTIQASGVSLQGKGRSATTWVFDNGGLDCIEIGAVYTTVIYSTQISGINVQGLNKSGGNGISIISAGQSIVRDMTFSNMSNGIYNQFINDVLIENCIILVQNASGYGWAIAWYAVAGAATTANALIIKNVTINCFGNNAQGIEVDGPCNTLRLEGVGIIHASNGLIVKNTQQSNQFFPEFIFANDLEIDGVAGICVWIQAGRQMKFINCDFFSTFTGTPNTDCVYIQSDGGYSVTNSIFFDNCRISGADQNGVACYAKNVFFSNCYVGDNAVNGTNTANGIVLGNDGGVNGTATSVTISGGAIGAVFGDLGNQAYGVTVAAGCSRVTINGVDFANNATGSIYDGTGAVGNVFWHGCYDINGVQLADRLPALASTIASPVNGIIYYNAQTATLQTYLNGVLRTIQAT